MPKSKLLAVKIVALLAFAVPSVLPGGMANAQVMPTFQPQAGLASVVFRARTGRAGAVDVFIDGALVLKQALATDVYNTFKVPAGAHEITIKSAYDGTLLARRTLNFWNGEVYAIAFENYAGTSDYRLRAWQGSAAAYALINADD